VLGLSQHSGRPSPPGAFSHPAPLLTHARCRAPGVRTRRSQAPPPSRSTARSRRAWKIRAAPGPPWHPLASLSPRHCLSPLSRTQLWRRRRSTRAHRHRLASPTCPPCSPSSATPTAPRNRSRRLPQLPPRAVFLLGSPPHVVADSVAVEPPPSPRCTSAGSL
jgi:hypothetical protein